MYICVFLGDLFEECIVALVFADGLVLSFIETHLI